MQVHVRMMREEIPHQLCFVGRKVIQNDMDFFFGWATRDDLI